MLRLPPLTSIKAFEATVRCGGVGAASRELHVTSAAVNQQLRKLEVILGFALFERRSRALVPTSAARELAADLTRSFQLIGEAIERHAHTIEERRLRIRALPSVVAKVIIPALPRLERFRPRFGVSFTYVHRASEFTLTDVDALICVTDAASPRLGRTLKLLGGRVLPVCAARYLKKLGRPDVSMEALVGMDLLHDLGTADWVSWFRKAGIATSRLRPGIIFEDFGLLSSALLLGQGIALCPVELFAEEIAQGSLIQLSDIAIHEDRAYCAVLPDDPAPEAVVFCEWLSGVATDFSRRDEPSERKTLAAENQRA
jgi:LysR family transcriptional regulator, glycine cleavage system transcriptional activator